jgi:hypothetical protein
MAFAIEAVAGPFLTHITLPTCMHHFRSVGKDKRETSDAFTRQIVVSLRSFNRIEDIRNRRCQVSSLRMFATFIRELPSLEFLEVSSFKANTKRLNSIKEKYNRLLRIEHNDLALDDDNEGDLE